MEQYKFFLGVDWGTQVHELCLQAQGDPKLQRQRFEHTPHYLGQMLVWIAQRIGGRWNALAVAIERPHGLVVQLLLARRAAVFAINPKKLDRFRERYNVAGAKSDDLDAAVLLDTLQKDSYAYNQVVIQQPQQLMLRELTHTLEDVEVDLQRQCNRLWDMLVGYYPALLALTGGADEAWLWDLLGLAPTPAQGAALNQEELAALLRRHHIRRIKPEQLKQCLGQPALDLAPGYVEAQAERTLILARCAQNLEAQARGLQRRIEQTLGEIARAEATAVEQAPEQGAQRSPTDYEIIDSLVGCGPKTMATLYSEALEPLRQRNYHQLRSLVGAAPVTERSGKHYSVRMRYACNSRLRRAMHHAANIAWQKVGYWGEMYAALRRRGKSHGRALRGLVDRMLKVLVSMLRHHTLFDPTQVGRIQTGL
jgi:transposase